MASLPNATVTISAEAGALAGGTGHHVIIAPVAKNADTTPRVYGSASAIYAQHDYSPGVDYAGLFIEATKKPVIFVGIPVATAGVLGRQSAAGVTGTSVISVAAGALGYLEETDAILTVTTGGTIGVTGIKLSLSLDGGSTSKTINLGTATSYTIPYVGIVVSFAAGTLVAADVYRFTTTAPMWDSTGMAAARTALAAQLKSSRSWMVIGDVSSSALATNVTTAVNAYETVNSRFVYARVNVRDRLPLASMSRVTVRMSGTPTLTFLEVGAGSDTITRSAGSFVTDGFAINDVITVAGSVSNNVTAVVTGVSALVLTLGAAAGDDLADEGPISNCTIVGSNRLLFAATTATRSGGSWLSDGFAVGDSVTFGSTASNNITVAITVLTATVLTFAAGGAGETIGSRTATAVKGETLAAYVALMDTAFVTVAAQKRIDIGIGRLRKDSPLTLWNFRRPVCWAASIREYQHDVHTTTWQKEDGPLDGWSMLDAAGNVVEYDDRTSLGAASIAGFTSARTWGNGPAGSFISRSLTRDTEGSVLAQTHNLAVANVACGIVHAATENIIGKSVILDDSGFASGADLQIIEEAINTDLAEGLLRQHVPGEGARASLAVWRASTDDDLSAADATLTGVLDLQVNGTIVNVSTAVKVR